MTTPTMTEYEIAHLDLLAGLFEQMTQISKHLGDISEYMAPAAPNWTHDLTDFASFDWSSIGATVTKEDDYGPATVEWRGKQYTRRSPQNKFGAAIWFSRPSGKTEDGSVKYERLITFRPFAEAEPISREAEKSIRQPPAAPVHTPHPAPAARQAPVSNGPQWTEPEFGPDPFDDLLSATTDPAVKQALAKAGNGNGKRPAWQDPEDHAKQQVTEAAARAAFQERHAPPAPPLTHQDLDRIAAGDERSHAPAQTTARPFKDQGSAVQWACRFEHYRKDGKPDIPHAVGSLNNIIQATGCKEKDVDCWANAWIKHVSERTEA